MPINISEFAEPSFTKHRTRYVGNTSTDHKDRFPNYSSDNPRSWRGENGYKTGGYNPNHQSTRTEKVNLYVDDYSLKPY